MQRTLIWDLPTRLFHWALAVSFALAWLTAESDPWLSVHVFLGYLMLGLVGFRVLWGFVGSHYSRFSSFWFGPREAMGYLKQVVRGQAERHVGHNPTGSLAIYLLLLLALVVGVTGMLTLGGEEKQGLAAGWFSVTQGRWLKKLHEAAATGMLLLVMGHIAGVVVESVLHRENLARSMLTGTKLAEPGTPRTGSQVQVAVTLLVAILSFAGWWFYYAIDEQLDHQVWHHSAQHGMSEKPHVKFIGKALPDNKLWRDECGSCHAVFHPVLLPARSWQKMMAEQDKHFGTDLGLDSATTQTVLKFMVDNAAEGHTTEAATKIDLSLAQNVTPLRITETPYWVKKHREVAASDWAKPQVKSKTNCAACHSDADAGTFEDGAMQIPKD